VPPGDTLPLEVNGISQFPPFCVDATTLKSSRFCPRALIVTGMVDGFPCAAPGCAVKFSVAGLAVNSVRPPTVMVAITVVGLAPVPCGMI
jgi:hypothetical protein